MPKVSINLVTWNGERYIENCLRSVLNQTFKDYAIIIIDNGSTDQTVELINERFPQFKVIHHKENLGFAKAHNQAIHWTNSDYILCLNQDVVLAQNFLEALVSFMDSHSLAGAVTGKILRLQDSQETKYIDSVGLKISKSFRIVDLGTAEVDEEQYDIAEEVFGASGAAPLYRRKALEEVSFQKEFFDESFFSYKEDVDLSMRLRIAGWQIWRAPAAAAYHDRTVTVPLSKETKMLIVKNRRRKSRFANFHSYRNHLYFLIKCLPKFSVSVFFYELGKLLYLLFFEFSTLRAWKDVAKNWRTLATKRKIIWKNKKVELNEIRKWLN